MASSWQGLLASAGVVALFISLWSYSPCASGSATRLRQILFGILFGIGAVLCMVFAFEVQPGVIIDLRNVLIVLGALFGGPIAGVVIAAEGQWPEPGGSRRAGKRGIGCSASGRFVLSR